MKYINLKILHSKQIRTPGGENVFTHSKNSFVPHKQSSINGRKFNPQKLLLDLQALKNDNSTSL